MGESFVTPRLFQFLRQLAENNERAWFEANKQRYLDEVRDPLLHFITAFAPRLAKIAPHLVADPRPMGGSLFRIYRDTRFARDKSPYKTHAAIHFRHGGRDVHGAGYYVHLEPGQVFFAAGMWRPEPETLQAIRDAIVERPKEWQSVRKRIGELDDHGEGDRLKRPPKGYDPEHRFIEDLKRRSFTSSVSFTQKQACQADFLDRVAAVCKEKAPLMQFLCRAGGAPW